MSFMTLRDGVRLRVCLRRGGSRNIVLVHGWRQSHRLFDRVIVELQKDCNVLAFDQRGMGESDKPDSEYDFARMAADFHEVVEWAGFTDCTVVGWSMGCTTTLSAAAMDSTRIRRIILMNGPLRLTRTADFSYALTPEEWAFYVEALEADWPRGESEFFQNSLLPENVDLAPLLEYVGRQTPLDVALKLVRQQAMVDHRSTIEQLTLPILAAYSDRDPYWPYGLAEWIAEHAAEGSHTAFRHSGHCAPLEEPDAVCSVIREFSA